MGFLIVFNCFFGRINTATLLSIRCNINCLALLLKRFLSTAEPRRVLRLKTTPVFSAAIYLKEILFVTKAFGLLMAADMSKELNELFNR